jgi:hypothetical protein
MYDPEFSHYRRSIQFKSQELSNVVSESVASSSKGTRGPQGPHYVCSATISFYTPTAAPVLRVDLRRGEGEAGSLLRTPSLRVAWAWSLEAAAGDQMPYLSRRALEGLKAYEYKPAGYTYLDKIHAPFYACEPGARGAAAAACARCVARASAPSRRRNRPNCGAVMRSPAGRALGCCPAARWRDSEGIQRAWRELRARAPRRRVRLAP